MVSLQKWLGAFLAFKKKKSITFKTWKNDVIFHISDLEGILVNWVFSSLPKGSLSDLERGDLKKSL